MKATEAKIWVKFFCAARANQNVLGTARAAVIADDMLDEFYKRFEYDHVLGRWRQK